MKILTTAAIEEEVRGYLKRKKEIFRTNLLEYLRKEYAISNGQDIRAAMRIADALMSKEALTIEILLPNVYKQLKQVAKDTNRSIDEIVWCVLDEALMI